MTKRYRAEGAFSCGGLSSTGGLVIGSTITDGHKPAVGQFVSVSLSPENLAFVLSTFTSYYPEAVRALCYALTDTDNAYGAIERKRPGVYDIHHSERTRRYRDAVLGALNGGYESL